MFGKYWISTLAGQSNNWSRPLASAGQPVVTRRVATFMINVPRPRQDGLWSVDEGARRDGRVQ